MREQDLRRDIIQTARTMNAQDINQGTSGNISARFERGFLITPSNVDYEVCVPDDFIRMSMDGTSEGPHKPSSEWRIHRDLLTARPKVQAVLHAHPTFTTALACLRRGIPAFHYMVAVAGGRDIRCATYATFGTEELSLAALEAMTGRTACLLANHGMVAVAGSLEKVLKLAIEVETLAHQYYHAMQIGEPVILDDAEMDVVLGKLPTYICGLDDTDGDME